MKWRDGFMQLKWRKNARVVSDKLKKHVDASQFDFTTTDQLDALTSIVGQERGRTVMNFGLNMNQEGYNVYVSGISGTGKTSFTKSIVSDFAKREVTLYDWCYVYNFNENNYRPKVLQVPAGKGKSLQQDMEGFMKEIEEELPGAFSEENYQKDRNAIIQAYKEETNQKMDTLNDFAAEYNFQIKQTSSGMVTIPLKDGQQLGEEAYKQLPEEERKEIERKSYIVQEKIMGFSDELKELEKKYKKELEKLDQQVAEAIVRNHLSELEERYEDCPEIINYLKDVQTDIVDNIQDFLPKAEQESSNPMQAMRQQQQQKQYKIKYKVNVMVDNSQTEGKPVVEADNPTYYNLLGKVEYVNQMGVMSTDFTRIKPGFLHQANGGYLIIQVRDILTNAYVWEGLKRALKHQQIQIENIGEQTGLVAMSSIKPDPIPLDVKVVLIGNRDIYQLLYRYDEDFRKLFKVKADFDIEMDADEENIQGLTRFIHSQCEANDLHAFDREAVARVVEYTMRLTNHQEKLSTRFNQIVEILYEANTWASLEQSSIIKAGHVKKAIAENEYRHNLFEEKMQEQIIDGDILISTEGEAVGQVNGLAVYTSGQYNFGKPTRITATTFTGQKGIINIERESKMSGSIHNKGVYILGGYLGETFAQANRLTVTAHIAFEQSYGGVDGDSASSTELYAILSSLADVPIDQEIAVTGSVNQKGDIQPIGGVNEKIEGFFSVCKQKGFTGNQGVIIPEQNVKNLMLKDEVIAAVQEEKFHIYAVRHIIEGIGILTNWPVDEKDEAGEYTSNSVYGKVKNQLVSYAAMTKNKKEQQDSLSEE